MARARVGSRLTDAPGAERQRRGGRRPRAPTASAAGSGPGRRRRHGGARHRGAGRRPASPRERARGRLARSTAFFSLATSLSRVAGLVREIFAA